MSKTASALGLDRAEEIGLTALTFLAEDAARLGRFLALTGMGPEELRRSAGFPSTLAAVLEHILRDESLLLVFASAKGVPPESLDPARVLLQKMSA